MNPFIYLICFILFKNLFSLPLVREIKTLSRNSDKIVLEIMIGEKHFAKLKFISNKKEYKRELKTLKSLNHKNIIKFISCNDEINIIIEELGNCSLFNFIRNPNYFFNKYKYNGDRDLNKIKINIIKQIIKGIKYIHQTKNRVHLDIKPQNIVLFFKENNIIAKLIDFTSCYKIKKTSNRTLKSPHGTFEYLAPEIINNWHINKEYEVSFNTDIYSLGVTIYFILNNKSIGQIADNEIQTYYNAQTDDESKFCFIDLIKNRNWRPPILNTDFVTLNKLIIKCWNPVPNKRPAIKECYKTICKLI